MPAKMKNKKTKLSELKTSSNLLDAFSPLKVGRILPTSDQKKENVFEKFKPKTGECLDYNISETFVKWDVGDTKINVKDIKATYVPASPEAKPKKKKVKYSHGGPPLWPFVDEIWRRKQDELQIQNKKNFKQFLIRRNQRHLQHASMLHNLIVSMVGPAWFQELSPSQLKTADNLSYAIFQDYRDRTIVHTEESIAGLGLVLRPNSKHVELALKLCCGCAVEFLLILYQLINPSRKSYSVNDRLLLSAVVHLTITETLRELHVRIPSPPRPEKRKTKVPKKVAETHYKSPYLVPYTFQPEPQKYTGRYENKHIQYPDSPYFSYLRSLRWEIQNCDNILDFRLSDLDDADHDERDLIEDMQNAQKMYNTMCKSDRGVKLLRPTVKKTCQDFQTYSSRGKKGRDEMVLPPLAPSEDTSEICTCLVPLEDSDDDYCCEYDFPEGCDCEAPCCCREKSKLFIASLCQRCIAQKQHKNARNIITGVTATKSGNVVPIVGGTFVEKSCQCMTEYKQSLTLAAARNRIKCQKAKYVVGGVAYTKIGPVYSISTAVMKKEEEEEIHRENDICTVVRNNFVEKTSVTVDGTDCECKKELDRYLEHKCTCEECQTEQTMYIVQGIKCVGEKPVSIISGVQDQKCDCLQKYSETLNKAREYRARASTRLDLKRQNTKYMITGVVNTVDGPVYCIGGIRPPVQCVCAEVARRRAEADERGRRMAKRPDTGRIKYEISGVRGGSRENTFIISQALPVEPCSCEKLLAQYEAAHKTCLEYYDDYVLQMEMELSDDESERSEITESGGEKVAATEESSSEMRARTEPTSAEPTLDVGASGEVETPPESPVRLPAVLEECCSSESSECFRSDSEPSVTPLEASPLAVERIEDGADVALKRFVVSEKIPCDSKGQRSILKKVLAGMANDGFPLAKLPDCHKLPHFKLWMQFRCGKFWKQKDKLYYDSFSKFGSKHTQVCYQGIPVPKLNISHKEARKLTWMNADFCRNMIKDINDNFHRAVKQQRINGAREYFPLTFSYEFPTPTFRDCYFAYFPSKEEDIFVG